MSFARKIFIHALAVVATFLWLPVHAFTLTLDAGSNTPESISSATQTWTVTLHNMQHIGTGTGGFTGPQSTLVNNEFDGFDAAGNADAGVDWTYLAGFEKSGTITVNQYDASFTGDGTVGGTSGGAIVDLSFNTGGVPPTNLRWIQFVTTNVPINANPTVDPPRVANGGDDNLPFYFTNNEITNGFTWQTGPNQTHAFSNPGNPRVIQNPSATIDLEFLDYSRRGITSAQIGVPINWSADLYLVEWDGTHGGTVTVHDGVRWGWTMTVVPIPAAVWLMLSALGSLWMMRRKRAPTAAA